MISRRDDRDAAIMRRSGTVWRLAILQPTLGNALRQWVELDRHHVAEPDDGDGCSPHLTDPLRFGSLSSSSITNDLGHPIAELDIALDRGEARSLAGLATVTQIRDQLRAQNCDAIKSQEYKARTPT